eukprot:257140-Rhodomonas_salina.1
MPGSVSPTPRALQRGVVLRSYRVVAQPVELDPVSAARVVQRRYWHSWYHSTQRQYWRCAFCGTTTPDRSTSAIWIFWYRHSGFLSTSSDIHIQILQYGVIPDASTGLGKAGNVQRRDRHYYRWRHAQTERRCARSNAGRGVPGTNCTAIVENGINGTAQLTDLGSTAPGTQVGLTCVLCRGCATRTEEYMVLFGTARQHRAVQYGTERQYRPALDGTTLQYRTVRHGAERQFRTSHSASALQYTAKP